MYDTIIVGGGIAGLTAALYAQRREMKTLLISADIGGQINWAGEIENYPGFELISAAELNQRLERQARRAGFGIRLETVQKIEALKPHGFRITTATGVYESLSVIFSLGLVPRRLAVPGEKELSGRGVSYCANCDGPFFKGKNVAVIGGGNAALDAAEVLSKIAATVYLIHRRAAFTAFESLVEAVKKRPNIKINFNSVVTAINGSAKVESATVKNLLTDSAKELPLAGVFVEIGHFAQSDLVADLVKRDAQNQIIIDDACRTSCPGLFAAGDITTVEHKQLSIAAGQGTIAALNAYQYVRQRQAD